MHRPLLYRLQYQKILWGNLKKVWQKKNVFAQKYDEIRRLDGTLTTIKATLLPISQLTTSRAA